MSAGIKRAWNAFLAVCLAMSMSMTGVFAWADEAASASSDATSGDTAYMQVYVKDSADAPAQLAKSYTQDEFEALATEGADSSYQYMSKGAWQAAASSSYVELTALFDDAEVAVSADDTVTTQQYVNDDPSDKSNFTSTDTWGNMIGGQFYPNASADDLYNVEGAYETAPILALTYGTQAYDGYAGEAAAAAAVNQSTKSCPKLLYGISADQFNAQGNAAGNRLCGNVNRITVTKAADPEPADPDVISIYAQDFDGSNKTQVATVKQSDLDNLAIEGQANVQYAGRGSASVIAATSYVELSSLFEEMGVEVSDDDSLTFAQTIGSTFEGPAATWGSMQAGKFFPDMDAAGNATAEGAVSVAPMVALSCGTSAITTTAADATEAAALASSDANAPRVLFGATYDDVVAGNIMGKRFVSNFDTITITRAKVDPVVFTVNVVDGDAVQSIPVKQSQLDALAQQGQASVQYSGKGKANVITATSYVTVSDLFADLDIALSATDKLQFAQNNAAKPFAGPVVSWQSLADGKFFPNAEASSSVTEGAVSVEPMLALICGTSAITTTAGDAAVEAAKAENQSGDSAVRVLYGATEADFAAGENIGGNRFVSNIDTITVTRTASAAVTRLGGIDAADTAAAISGTAFGKSDTVVLATDSGFADAMSATGLAGAYNAPILLTAKDSLSSAAAAEIQRMRATNVIIVGGTAVISDAVKADLVKLGIAEGDISRVFGQNAEDTSVECAKALAAIGAPADKAIVVNSWSFQDALSASSFAYKYHVPVFVQTAGETSDARALPASAVEMLTGNGYYAGAEVIVPGGTGAVSEKSVEGALGDHVYTRIFGNDGYDTSLAVADYMVKHNLLTADNLVVASGAISAGGTDALAGAALAGSKGSVIVLANGQADIEPVNMTALDSFLDGNAASIDSAFVLGGSYVMPDDVIADIDGRISK